jgi:5-methylcytosine-specific restriction protein A
MPPKFCITCGRQSKGSYCPAHTPKNRRGDIGRGVIRGAQRRRIMIRDRYTCQLRGPYCVSKATHIDHRIPVAQGGPDEDWNLVAACEPCNKRKGHR